MAENNQNWWDSLTDEQIVSALGSGEIEIPTDILASSLEEQNNFEPTTQDAPVRQETDGIQPGSAFEIEKQADVLPQPKWGGFNGVEEEASDLRLGALDQFKGQASPSFKMPPKPTPEPAPTIEQEVAEVTQKKVPKEPTQAAGIVAPAAEFIGGIEAPKGYNQIQGHNKFADLDQMTLNEVKDLQEQMQGSPEHESSAVGRYQIISTTMDELMRRMKLKGNEKFTPELQDRMFNTLLKKRGLNDFLVGNIDEFDFANNLAKEWASLPVVKDVGNKEEGFSYYAGVGSNKSLVDPEDVLSMVRDLRDDYQVDQGPQSGGGGGGGSDFSDEEGPELLKPVMQKGKQLLTEEGRPVYENQWGDQVTERTITENINGKWYNIPTVYDGQFVDPLEAIQRVQTDEGILDPITGRELEPFDSLIKAVKSAEARSPTLFTETEEE